MYTPCKPQFYYINVGFKGSKLYKYVFVMCLEQPVINFHMQMIRTFWCLIGMFSKIENTLQRELEVVSDWLINNKLILHLGKTESILFRSRPRLKIKSA